MENNLQHTFSLQAKTDKAREKTMSIITSSFFGNIYLYVLLCPHLLIDLYVTLCIGMIDILEALANRR